MNIVKVLEECREMVIEWGTQVDSYFQKKWDLKADIKKLDEWIADEKVREHIDSVLPENKSRVEELSELIYDILDKYGKKEYDISGISDKQDIAWDIATEIYNKYKK